MRRSSKSGSRRRRPRAIALASDSIAFTEQKARAFMLPGDTGENLEKMQRSRQSQAARAKPFMLRQILHSHKSWLKPIRFVRGTKPPNTTHHRTSGAGAGRVTGHPEVIERKWHVIPRGPCCVNCSLAEWCYG